MYTLKPHEIQRMKELYPPGTRVELLQMGNDPNPVPPGSKGSVVACDDLGTVHVDFDNGRKLGLIPGEDSFRKAGLEKSQKKNKSQER